MLKDCWLYKKTRMIAVIATAIFLASNTAYPQSNTAMEKDSAKDLLYHARNSCLSVRTAKYYVHSYRSNPDGKPAIHSGNVLLYRDSTNNPLGWKVRFEADNGIIYCYTGEEVKVLDPKSKRFITVDAAQGADKMIKGGVISGLIFNVLTDTAMWENIIHLSNDVSLEEDQKMESILCKVIKVSFPDTELFSQLTTRLCIDPNSFLVHKKINHSVYNRPLSKV
ncbi:MAG: hypothetical protein IPM61_09345 [Chlorobi bacterium]|nr:MAG: hypothetical protein UZ07_CHB004001611 [Chlorobi bacterium OLB7]MBK8911518.1 hypothetical protein [Chlorobiota bacterium]